MSETARMSKAARISKTAIVESISSLGSSIVAPFRGRNLLASMRALVPAGSGRAVDETHYLLVPTVDGGHSVFVKRVLPEARAATTTVRIFHVSHPEADRHLLEQQLLEQHLLPTPPLPESESESPLADALDKLADDVDDQTRKVTGGLLVIGGTVAVLVNPLAGAAIAAKALVPALGIKAASSAADYLSGQLRDLKRRSRRKERRKAAEKTLERLKPRIFHNPLLAALSVSASDAPDLVAIREGAGWPEETYPMVTVEAIREVYSSSPRESISPALRRAIDALAATGEAQPSKGWREMLEAAAEAGKIVQRRDR